MFKRQIKNFRKF